MCHVDEWHYYAIKLSVAVRPIMQRVIILSAAKLSVATSAIRPNAVMLNVNILSVVAPGISPELRDHLEAWPAPASSSC
jgi:hypothetical protein